MDETWLKWVRRLQAIGQNGLTFSRDPFDRERYEEVQSIAREILASSSGMDAAAAERLLGGEEGYATPKIDVRGGVFQGDRLLFVREKSDGLWTLPGGWADVGESPSAAVEREIREESGFATRVAKLVALYDRNKHEHPPMLFHAYKAFFLCDIVGGSPATSQETSATGFFPRDELPELSRPRVTLRQVDRLFAHFRDPALPTEFD
jgi:ADP-ribose pyrophosphatase YjhB (NUDIX family)